MDDLLDMVASDESPSQISDKIKELLFSTAERIDAYRPEVASAVFDGEDVVEAHSILKKKSRMRYQEEEGEE